MRLCSIEGCERAHSAKTLCRLHYNRQYTTGTVGAQGLTNLSPGTPCRIEDCENVAKSQALCQKHYVRLWRTGTTDILPPPPVPPKACAVAKCPEVALRRGMCQCHYKRFLKHGDASVMLVGADVSLKPRAGAACAFCGADLAGKRRNAVYCSKPCGTRAAALRSATRRPKHLREDTQVSLVTLEDYRRIKNAFAGCCAYCGARPTGLHMDHVVPLGRGGQHAIGNLLPACPPCNLSKGDSLLTEWRLRQASRR